MTEKSIKSNYIYNTASQVLSLLIPLITVPYISRILTPSGVGKYSFANSIVAYFVVFCNFGSSIFGQKNVAFYRENKEKLSEVFWNVVSFRLVFSVLFSVSYLICLLVSNNLNPLFCAAGINIVSIFFDISWFYQGVEDFQTPAVIGFSVKAIWVILVFSFIKSEEDVVKYVLLLNGISILGSIVFWLPLGSYILKPTEFKPFKNTKEMFLLFLPTIATQVYLVLDKSMIGWITKSDYSNGCYEQSERIARVALSLVTGIGAVILPRIANLYKKEDIDSVRYYVYKALRTVWALGLPMMFGAMAVSSFLIPVFLGNGYDLSVILLQIFSLLILFVSLAYIIGLSYLIPTNQQNVYTASVSIAAAINLVMNLFLIPRYGAIGAAIASVTAEFIGVTIQIGFCLKTCQLSFKGIIASSIKYWIASVIMFVLLITIKKIMYITVINLLLLIVIGAISYFIVLVVLRDSLLFEILKTGISGLKKDNRGRNSSIE